MTEAALAHKVGSRIEAAYPRSACSSAGAGSWMTWPATWPARVERRRPVAKLAFEFLALAAPPRNKRKSYMGSYMLATA